MFVNVYNIFLRNLCIKHSFSYGVQSFSPTFLSNLQYTRCHMKGHVSYCISRPSVVRTLYALFFFCVSDGGYFRKAYYALNLISAFLFLSLGRYLWWGSFSPRCYQPSSNQCFGTDMAY
jgi:hypothetical protein